MPGAVGKGAPAKKKAAAPAAAPAAEPASKESAVLNLSTKLASIDLEKDKHLRESGSWHSLTSMSTAAGDDVVVEAAKEESKNEGGQEEAKEEARQEEPKKEDRQDETEAVRVPSSRQLVFQKEDGDTVEEAPKTPATPGDGSSSGPTVKSEKRRWSNRNDHSYTRYPGVRGLFYPPGPPTFQSHLFPRMFLPPIGPRRGGYGGGRPYRPSMAPKSPHVARGVTSPTSTERNHRSESDVNNNRISATTMSSMSVSAASEATSRTGSGVPPPPPLIYVSPSGTISVVLAQGIVVETSVDRAVRVVCHDKFAAAMNGRGTATALLHKQSRVLHTDDKVFCKFLAAHDKMAVMGPKGILFTMAHLAEAFLVSSAFTHQRGTSAVALDQLCFPAMNNDFTLQLFYTEAQTGVQYQQLCEEIVHQSSFELDAASGAMTLFLNGFCIRQTTDGDVSITARPRHITCSPAESKVAVRTSHIDMGVQDADKAFVKRAVKRVHVSRSGMVVSDGNSVTSMDHFGRIVSST